MATSQTHSRPPLRDVRVAKGLGLNEATRRAGIDTAHLSRVERGEARLSLASLHRLAVALDLHELAKFIGPYTEDAPG